MVRVLFLLLLPIVCLSQPEISRLGAVNIERDSIFIENGWFKFYDQETGIVDSLRFLDNTIPQTNLIEPSKENIEEYICYADISDDERKALTKFVGALQSNDLWKKMIFMYPFLGGTAESHSIEFFNPIPDTGKMKLVMEGSLVHSATGMKANGSQGWARLKQFQTQAHNTGFSYYAKSATNDNWGDYGDALIGARSNTNILDASANVAGNTDIAMFRTNTGLTHGYCNDTAPLFGSTPTSGDGVYTITRPDAFVSTGKKIYHNGGIVESEVTSNPDYATLNDIDFYIGNPKTYNDTEFRFVAYHYGFDDTEAQLFSDILHAFQTELGRATQVGNYASLDCDIIYDERDNWCVEEITTTTPWPALDGAKLIFEGGCLYHIGGWNVPFQIYKSCDLGASWILVSSPPITSRHSFGFVKFNGLFVVLGGDVQRPNSEVWVSPDLVSWNKITTAPYPTRSKAGYAVYNNELYAISGSTGNANLGTEINDVWKTPDLINWIQVTSGTLPTDMIGCNNHVVLGLQDALISIGAFKYDVNPTNRYSSRNVYSSNDGVTWDKIGEICDDKQYRDCVYDGNNIYCFGGESNWQGGLDGTLNSATLYVSKDRGRTFDPIYLSHSEINWVGGHASAITVIPQGLLIASTNSDILFGTRVYLIRKI